MIKKTPISLAVLTALGSALISVGAYATNGYFSNGVGTASKGVAGAGAAIGMDALSSGTNPAGMGLIGDRLDVGAALFFPTRGFTANSMWTGSPNPSPLDNAPPIMGQAQGCPPSMCTGSPIPPGDYTSKNDIFLIPHFGYNKVLDDKSTIGISLAGNGGMNTEYDSDIFRNYNYPDPRFSSSWASSPTGIDLMQAWIGVPYTYKITPEHVLAIMPLVAIQRLKVDGVEPFSLFSEHPDKVSNNGYDWSYGMGVRLGWIGNISEMVSLGASYQTRTWMSEFDKYKGLLAEHGDFDVPPTMQLGVALKVIPDVTLLLDYQRIWYGDIKSMNNTNLMPMPIHLGDSEGLGFGWKDQDIFKVGAIWRVDPSLTLRTGYSYATAAFNGNQGLFNVLAPAVTKQHVSLGFTYGIDKNNEIGMSYTYALKAKEFGENAFLTGPQSGYLEMSQHDLEFNWGYRF
ncbi:long-chain fatty acid transport protein [Gammaproteobacteria bacterium]